MSNYVYAVVLGLAFAFYIHFSQCRSVRKKLQHRFPDLMERWCGLDRRTRRTLTKDMRSGRTVPAEHAEIVVGMIDVSVTLENERLPTFRRRVIRVYAGGLVIVMALVLGLFFSDTAFRFLEVIYITTVAEVLVALTIGVVLTRRRLRTWPANRARTRDRAMLDLGTATTSAGV